MKGKDCIIFILIVFLLLAFTHIGIVVFELKQLRKEFETYRKVQYEQDNIQDANIHRALQKVGLKWEMEGLK